MKKFLMIAGLAVAAIVATSFGACTSPDTTNQAANEITVSASPEPTATAVTQPKKNESTVSTREVILEHNIFRNEAYRYQVTIPIGYQVLVEETRNDSLPDGGWDRAIIKNSQDQELATIRTPAPEIGFELWTWTEAKRSVSRIPGSSDTMYRYEVLGDRAMGMERDLIAASWGFDMHDSEVAATRDYGEGGLISAEVPSLAAPEAQKVRDLISSLRILPK